MNTYYYKNSEITDGQKNGPNCFVKPITNPAIYPGIFPNVLHIKIKNEKLLNNATSSMSSLLHNNNLPCSNF